ncbi:MAG: L7Ae/L30e/S12e/Gadd45 family ribosomal protein [Acidobacteriota bacterium]
MKKDVYQLIGLACRAGKVSSGTMAAKTSLLRRRASLLIISSDISENTKDSLVSASAKRGIPWLVLGDKYRLGAQLGRAYRVALTINDNGFSDAIFQVLNGMGQDEASDLGVVEWQR